jgi:hypothetical protein
MIVSIQQRELMSTWRVAEVRIGDKNQTRRQETPVLSIGLV